MFTRILRITILSAALSAAQTLVAKAATPLPPTNLTATATSETTVVLAWTDNSTNENSFKIERSNNPTTGFVQIGKTKANVKTFTNKYLSPASGYYYRVYAFRRNNPPSAYTNVAFVMTLGRDSVPPTMPTGLGATAASCTQIDLRWDPSSDAGSGVAGYQVYRGGSVIANVATASFSDSALAASSSFTYNVAAFDNAGNYSVMSAPLTAATPSCTSNQAPIASAGADRTTLTLSSLIFDGSGSGDPDGSVVSHSWSFGDGTTGSGASVSHLWANPGTYSVVLTVTDNMGATASDTASVVVTQPRARTRTRAPINPARRARR